MDNRNKLQAINNKVRSILFNTLGKETVCVSIELLTQNEERGLLLTLTVYHTVAHHYFHLTLAAASVRSKLSPLCKWQSEDSGWEFPGCQSLVNNCSQDIDLYFLSIPKSTLRIRASKGWLTIVDLSQRGKKQIFVKEEGKSRMDWRDVKILMKQGKGMSCLSEKETSMFLCPLGWNFRIRLFPGFQLSFLTTISK